MLKKNFLENWTITRQFWMFNFHLVCYGWIWKTRTIFMFQEFAIGQVVDSQHFHTSKKFCPKLYCHKFNFSRSNSIQFRVFIDILHSMYAFSFDVFNDIQEVPIKSWNLRIFLVQPQLYYQPEMCIRLILCHFTYLLLGKITYLLEFM